MKVKVNPGYTVDDGNKVHYPNGKPFELDDKEAKRLVKRKIVSVVKVPTPPPVSVDQTVIVKAIGELDPENKKLWTKDKKNGPQTSALVKLLTKQEGKPVSVSSKERDTAYAAYLEANKDKDNQ